MQSEDSYEIILFGDQSCDVLDTLYQLLSSRSSCRHEKEFLRLVPAVVQDEINKLPGVVRQRFVSIRTIDELLSQYSEKQSGACNPAIDSVILSLAQLIQGFRWFARTGHTSNKKPTTVLGLCTGSLCAAALSSSATTAEFAALALPVLRIAFRIGFHAATVSENLNGDISCREPWTILFSDLELSEAQNVLDNFHKSIATTTGETPLHRRCYISASSHSTVTISGPPSALNALLTGVTELQTKNKLKIPIYAAFHSATLYQDLDIDWILAGGNDGIVKHLKQKHRQRDMLSAVTGLPIPATTSWDLFYSVVTDIFRSPLRWDRVLDECVANIRNSNTSFITLISVNAPNAAVSLESTIRSHHTGVLQQDNLLASMTSEILSGSPFSYAYEREPLAIVGMAGRFPDASNHEALWELLMNGSEVHREVPLDRFDASRHVDPSGRKKNSSWTPYGCFMDDPGHFDPAFFHMSPREALQTDPMQRLALVTAYEALEMSGFTPDRTSSTRRDRIGTFYGQTSDDYREVNASQEVDTYFIPGGIRAFGPGRINFHFKFSGPSYNVDTACSSSLAAVQLACTSIWNGECDTAVVGGVNVLTSPDLFSGLSRGQFLSRTGPCKTFDNEADGYCRADTVASVVIKRLSDARNDNDEILATILSAATNHSAEAVSITHPHADTQSKLYRWVLAEASMNPHDVSLIEMHGTGTQAGDSTEMQSVSEVFASIHKPRDRSNPLYVGSIKANIGHGEAASGITALIKSIMMLQKNLIPPHVGIKGMINQKFPDLEARNIKIARGATSIKTGIKPTTMLVNNFSAAGGNTAVMLQAYPEQPRRTLDNPQTKIVAVSGHTIDALRNNIRRLIDYLDSHTDICADDLAYTTTARRMHQKYRATVSGKVPQDIRVALAKLLNQSVMAVSKISPRRVIFVFTGQGALYPNIGHQFFECCTQAKLEFDTLNSMVEQNGFPSISGLVYGNAGEAKDPSPTQIQLGLLCMQIAMCRIWTLCGVKPDAVIGHSLGEYAAMYAAGILSAAEAIYLVGTRAQLLETQCESHTHGMLVVKASQKFLEDLIQPCGLDVEVACHNKQDQVVLSGPVEQIARLQELCRSQSVKCTKLALPYAFHSSQVECVLNGLEDAARNVSYKPSRLTYISALLGRPLLEGENIDAGYVRDHARKAVKFVECLQSFCDSGTIQNNSVFVEIGSHPLCSSMVRSNLGTETLVVSTFEDSTDPRDTFATSAGKLHDAGVEINWHEYYQLFSRSFRLLHVPTYAFDNKNYWIDYKNDWCLTKGEPQALIATRLNVDNTADQISSSVHRLIDSNFSCSKPYATFETNLSDNNLYAVITGHLVNDAGLCPSSVYADMAMTAAEYVGKNVGLCQYGLSVCNMVVSTPLNVCLDQSKESRILKLEAILDLTSKSLTINFSSFERLSNQKTRHASCVVVFEDITAWTLMWKRTMYLIQGRVDLLHKKAHDGKAHRILQQMSYKLFSNLVKYSERFQGMREVILDSPAYEAIANVVLTEQKPSENFRMNPYWIDCLVHIAGLVMNGSEETDPSVVYISHGWEKMSFARKPEPARAYQCYVKMQSCKPNEYAGDVWILQDDTVTAVCEGLKFQQIPKRVLSVLLPPGLEATASKTSMQHQVNTKVKDSRAVNLDLVQQAPPQVQHKISVGRLADKVRKIIADELGVDEVKDDDSFHDLGVDSLMSLTIVGILRETIQRDIPPSIFLDHPTVGDLLAIFDEHSDTSCAMTRNSPTSMQSDFDHEHIVQDIKLCNDVSFPTIRGIGKTGTGQHEFDSGTLAMVAPTFAVQLGIDACELSVDADLKALGMDSLMMLTIQSSLQERVGIILPPGFLAQHSTLAEVQIALSPFMKPAVSSTPQSKITDVELADFAATSIILHNPRPNLTFQNLFLFPDGSGSAASYADLPNLGPSIRVIALNSPFIKMPSAYTVGIGGAATLYVSEIRSRQIKGPYILAGWSAGGVLAIEAARQLVAVGESVEKLVLIDAPYPAVQEPMSADLVDFLDLHGVFGSSTKQGMQMGKSQARERMLAHFASSLRSLAEYIPTPLTEIGKCKAIHRHSGDATCVFIIEAADGICGRVSKLPKPSPHIANTRTARWILDDRKRGQSKLEWERMFPETTLGSRRLAGNHFSIMRKPHVQELAVILAEIMLQEKEAGHFREV